MEESTPTPLGFLDVPVLLEASAPEPRIPWTALALGGSAALMAGAAYFSQKEGGAAISAASSLLGFILVMSMPFIVRFSVRAMTREQQALAESTELVQLRHWPQAAVSIQNLLSRPMLSIASQFEALVLLAAVLTRYHRFEDAISVQTYLLDSGMIGGPAVHGLKLGRAMAMLHDERLYDADRAITDLRRSGPTDSGGLALVELYRDVKTGHPADAIERFAAKLPLIRDQLGHRLGDAYALVARAYDLLDRREEAALAFQRATVLSPAIELFRRYPEVQKLRDRYETAAAPVEMR